MDFDGHRKPLWYASRDFFAPRLATIQPRTSEEYRATHSWEGEATATDHLELIVLNDMLEAWKGTWSTTRPRCSTRRLCCSERAAFGQ